MTKRRFTHDETEALIAGRSDDHPEVAALVTALSAGWSGPTEDRGHHLAAIHEAAKQHAHQHGPDTGASKLASAGAVSRRRLLLDRSRAVAFKLSSSVVALSAATMGLAHAGVDLPGEAAEKAFSVVGIELPNQETDNGKSVADDVKAAKEGLEPGCERGQAVAAAASQNRRSESKDRPNPCDKKDDEGEVSGAGKAGGSDKSAEGRAKAEAAKAKGSKSAEAGGEGKPEAPGRSDVTERGSRGKGQGGSRSGDQGSSTNKERLDVVTNVVSSPSKSDVTTAKGSNKS